MMQNLFARDLDVRRIIADIELREGSRTNPSQTLIIFDKIQEETRAIMALENRSKLAR